MLPKQPKAALAFTALALLTLSACGGGENTASPASPSASSVSVSASSSAAASPEASPSESVSYSGGSKAPAGEYRPADEHGPAQNVPKPKAPEGMNVETLEGLEKFIAYWNDMRNYAIQTGDARQAQKITSKDWVEEQKFYSTLGPIYDSGGWVIGGTRKIYINKDFIVSRGDGLYSVACNFEIQDVILHYNGKTTYQDNSDSAYKGIEAIIKFDPEIREWVVEEAFEVQS